MNLARVLHCILLLLLSVSRAFALPGVTQRVSVSSSGEQANTTPALGGPWGRVSADGRYVVFYSDATNLVPGNPNAWTDVFVRNRVTGTTEQLSYGVGPVGCHGSADGRYVVFMDFTGHPDIPEGGSIDAFVWDRLLGTTEMVSVGSSGQGNDATWGVRISDDGRYVAFGSYASNLVAGDTNGHTDVFVRDRVARTTERVSVSSSGGQGYGESSCMSISADGRYVAFWSEATGLVLGDTNDWWDVFLRDRLQGTTELVSVSTSGETGNLESGCPPEISPDGRYVVFPSLASNLVPGDTNEWWDVFLRDRLRGTTERVSVSSSGEQGSSPGDVQLIMPFSGISADGRYVVFDTDLAGLVPGDTDDLSQVFLRDRVSGTTEIVSVTMSGEPAYAHLPSISADGRCIGFNSRVHDLVPADTNDSTDVFVWDMDARFHDVPSCFWAFPHIEACVNAEFVKGYDDNTYHPKYPVSRAQMAVFISRSLAGGDDSVPDGPAEAAFDDVPTGHWAYKYIEYCVANDIVQGFDPVTYGPTVTVARDAMAVFISRAAAGGDAGVPDGPAEATFDDVPTDNWAYKYIEYCAAEGIVQGYDPVTYGPTGAVSRDQMAVFIARAFMLS